VADRDQAAALTGAVVEVDRAALPPPGDREYYRADLAGFSVRNLEGAELGTVSHFVDMPAGPVMVTLAPGGRQHWVAGGAAPPAQGGSGGAYDSGGLAGGAGIEGSMKIEVVTLFPRMIAGASSLASWGAPSLAGS